MKLKKYILLFLTLLIVNTSLQAQSSYTESIKKFSDVIKANKEVIMLAGAVVGYCCIVVVFINWLVKKECLLLKRRCKDFVQALKRLREADPENVEELSQIMFNLLENNFRYYPIPTLLITNKVLATEPLILNLDGDQLVKQ